MNKALDRGSTHAYGRVVTWLLPLLVTLTAAAERPAWRWISAEDGLDDTVIAAITQAPDRTLWFATGGGVYRYDGRLVRRGDGGRLRSRVDDLHALGDGRVMGMDRRGRLWSMADDATREVALPEGVSGGDLHVDHEGRLLLLKRGLWRLEGSTWTRIMEGDATADAQVVGRGPPGVLVLGGKAWRTWREGDGHVELLGDSRGTPRGAVATDDGSVWTLELPFRLIRWSPDGAVLSAWADPDRTGVSLAAHGEEVWLATGQEVRRVRTDGSEVRYGLEQGVRSSFQVWVDHEGSLWTGGLHGVGQLVDPDVVRFGYEDGLESEYVRGLVVQPSTVWAATWKGVHRIDRETGRAERVVRWGYGAVCEDGDGRVWTAAGSDDRGSAQLVALTPDGEVHRFDVPGRWDSGWRDVCASSPQGHVWLPRNGRLYRTRGLEVPEDVGRMPVPVDYQHVMHESPGGELFVASESTVCRAPASAVSDEAWTCVEVDGPRIRAVRTTPSGALWLTGHELGVQRFAEAGWERIPAGEELPTLEVKDLVPSPAGGSWLAGIGMLLRVSDAPDTPEGWVVEERLAPWLRGWTTSTESVAEEADGTLWVATTRGVVRIPASSRNWRGTPPSVAAYAARVDGETRPAGDLRLPRPDSHLSVEFLADSFKAPRELRYRVRIDRRPWGEPVASGAFEFPGLPSGVHTIEVAASNDMLAWGEPARVVVTVPVPWYARPLTWVLAAFAGLLVVVGAAAAMVRVRVAREQLRTRIALDLHDEVGAGLGAMGLLAGMLRREQPAPVRDQLGERLERTANNLSDALRGIVWSLKPSSLRIGALGAYLGERAAGILAEHARDDRLELRLPDAGSADVVALSVLRAVQLIGLEALHNVARHAQAERVIVSLERVGRTRWRLVVEDDGVGLATAGSARSDSGNGLPGMRSRAAEISARLHVGERPGGGTRVQLDFDRRGR